MAVEVSPDLAALCASYIPAGARVSLIGGNLEGLRACLPSGCELRALGEADPSSLRDCDVVVAEDVLTRFSDPRAWLAEVREARSTLVCTIGVERDAAAAETALVELAGEAGLEVLQRDRVAGVYKLVPRAALPPRRPRRVLTLSYYNDANFGDRLGYHLVNAVLPASATVVHATVKPWTVPTDDFDLLILGSGHSLNAATVQRPELHALMERVPHTVGIFGTQYRYQYRELIDPELMPRLLSRLTSWWARNEEDLLAFGRGCKNARHLGDWLITAFPNAVPTIDRTLEIPPEIKSQEAPLDRVIQRIQAYRRVKSARIHPLLVALTSADAVAYQEQHEDPRGEVSGKFRSMLMDIFGRTYPEGAFFDVEHARVRAYKTMVEQNVLELKREIAALLDA